MIKVSLFVAAAGLLLATPGTGLSAEPETAPEFKEVYDLVRAHLSGLNAAELNRLAVDSFLAALRPKVSLIRGHAGSEQAKEGPALSRAMLLEGPIAYLRVAKADSDLPQAIREATRLMSATNKLDGLVLDLRYTESDDYAAAAAVADLFLKTQRKLLDWGNGMVSSKEKSDAMALPVAVLVNHETSGAPEALAAALRETGAGLVVGATTAGEAMIAQDYPLSNGQQIRIATAPVRLGDGSELSLQGVKPDIAVRVTAKDERAYYADGFKDPGNLAAAGKVSPASQPGATNRVRRPVFNEAELVRERKEGLSGDLGPIPAEPPSSEQPPTVHDPALARAMDVLKGLAVVRAARRS